METSPRGLVLVVEDEPAIADIQRRYLTREGFGVHVETDGHAALAAVARLRPVAVVLDVGLPGRDGVAVCRALRECGDWTPVLFVTARDDETDRIVGLEIGADVVMKATKVDGVYDKDPMKHDDAVKFDRLTHLEMVAKGLQVMDSTASTMSQDGGLPILVFNMRTRGNILAAARGEQVGTVVVPS